MDEVVTDTLRDQALGPDELAEHQELCQTVRTGIAALPPKHRSVVALYYLDGLSLQETADALGVRLGTVKSRLHYALDTLRRELVPSTLPADDVAASGRGHDARRWTAAAMIRRRADACVIHRPALVDFVERQALGPDSPAALDHLARCAPCERDLTEVAQTVFALRRLGASARRGRGRPPTAGRRSVCGSSAPSAPPTTPHDGSAAHSVARSSPSLSSRWSPSRA